MNPINNQGTESPNKNSGSSRILTVILAQENPQLIGTSLSVFDKEIKEILGNFPQTELLVFPELHLFGDGTPDPAREEALRASAEPLDGKGSRG